MLLLLLLPDSPDDTALVDFPSIREEENMCPEGKSKKERQCKHSKFYEVLAESHTDCSDMLLSDCIKMIRQHHGSFDDMDSFLKVSGSTRSGFNSADFY